MEVAHTTEAQPVQVTAQEQVGEDSQIEATVSRTSKITEADREAARQEREAEASESKMSEAAKAKLRAQNEAAKIDKEQTVRVLNEFRRIPKTIPALMQVLTRIVPLSECHDIYPCRECSPHNGGRLPLARMAEKLIWSLRHGWNPTTVGDIVFMGNLTPDELKMSDDRFTLHLAKTQCKNPIDLDQIDTSVEYSDKPKRKPYWNEQKCISMGLCKAGSLCLKADGKKPASAAEGRQYCSTNCQESYPVRKRALG